MIDHPGHERLSQTRARKPYRFFHMSADVTSASLSSDHHHLPKYVTQDDTVSRKNCDAIGGAVEEGPIPRTQGRVV